MKSHNCFDSEKDLNTCSKEELIEIVKNLRAENARLLSKTVEIGEKNAERSFKYKYALKILDTLPDMLTVLDDSGIILDLISSEETNHIGIPANEMKGIDIKAFLPGESYVNVMNNIKKSTETLQCCTSTHTLDKNGETHHYENRIFPLDTGYKLCMSRDETDATIAKKALENVSYAVNNANENIFALTSEGHFIFANKQFLKEHNLENSEITEPVYDVLFTIRNQHEWEEVKHSIQSNNGVHKYTSDVEQPDGTNVSYEIVAHSAKGENGTETFWFFARDVTLRRKQEIKIRELNDLMNAILKNIPVYLFVKDTGDDFRYLYWNKAFEEHSGIPESKAVGHTDFDIFPNRIDSERFRKDDLDLLRRGERIEFIEDYSSQENGQRIVKTIKLLVPRENEKPLLIGVSLDITDMKNVEQQLIEAKLAAEESNKLKSAFLANMSHEIRTPLNAIVGFSKLISSAETPEEKQQFSDIIDSNADLLLQLINDILDISKIEAGTLEFVKAPMDFTELCNTMYEVHKMKVPKGVSLIFEGKHSPLKITNDRNRLAQVFTNLLTNSIKFTKEGEIRFGYSIAENYIEAYVEDTGIGISESNVKSIFERFVKLNSFAQGTGLGLAITKMIIEKLGGTINVTSSEGQGTKFRFTIPFHNDSPPLQYPKQNSTDSVNNINRTHNAKKKSILIVEDNSCNYLLLKKFIGNRYNHYHARNGEDAIHLFSENKPDLILMDIKMPVMNGIEATKVIRNISQTVPIVALSAFAYEEDKKEALNAGCNDFLTKPVSFVELKNIFSQYIDS